MGTRARKSLWPAEGRFVAQFLWPGGFVAPKCSRCTLATLFLDQTIQASMYHIFWALNPWTCYGPSLGKCPNCTHLSVRTFLQIRMYVYTHDFANVFMDFQARPPILS